MMRSIIRDKSSKIAVSLAVAAFWLLVWHLLYRMVGKEILLVSPFHAVQRLWVLASQLSFWQSILASCLRVVTGFLAALVMGAVFAVLTSRIRILYLLLRPLMEVIKATPVASFIILALVWLSGNRIPVLMSFLMVLPIVWSNLYEGMFRVDNSLLEMAQVFRFSRRKTIRLIYVPALFPYFHAACSTGIGIAWKSAVAAEVIAHPQNSIGARIYDAKVYLETADLFAWTIAVVVLSLLLEALAMRLFQRLADHIVGSSRREA